MGQPITIKHLQKLHAKGEKFVMLTAYDATQAMLCGKAGVDVILVGDSLGMVVQGHITTTPVSVDDMVYHARAVARGAPNTVKMVDMPYMSFAHLHQGLENAARLMQEGHAEIIKVECMSDQHLSLVEALTHNGIPVCAHLGLTPQTIHKLGSFGKQGKTAQEAKAILESAQKYERAGADMLLLECVPAELAQEITHTLSIPVIGIGAGKDVDAQVLVMYDILGMSSYIPSFAKNFLAESGSIELAIKSYVDAVKKGQFP